ncbi:DUF3667 domain-containing protein [Neolewinella lacunae]|uniref:DUF3667 domain-containing protein n=1 Tax=Neolewinella lacunae TaxID=1517758 RepID=A0A923T7H7_9BACT|nr:DUF3667 domain-containing protein [Neolewinella lacunae]MBC6993594.1 DUF3667 domain-containing protein [Neolewinella lacunae]MDN3633474.1 DUF3667 domain-containing protein [Neolewinella lacunae]
MPELCKNCNTAIALHYCPNCGRPKAVPRVSGHYLLQEIQAVLSLEKGFLLTVRELAFNPGGSIKAFLTEDRNRLVKPIVFLILTSLIYTLLNRLLHFEDGYVNYSADQESSTLLIFQWVQNNYGYANIIMAVFIGFWIKVFFRKYQFNYFEILILLCFVMGMGMLIYAFFGLAQALTSVNLLHIGGMVGFAYTSYAVGHFFDKRKAGSYVKAFLAYIIGMITFSLAAIAVGMFIDAVM